RTQTDADQPTHVVLLDRKSGRKRPGERSPAVAPAAAGAAANCLRGPAARRAAPGEVRRSPGAPGDLPPAGLARQNETKMNGRREDFDGEGSREDGEWKPEMRADEHR